MAPKGAHELELHTLLLSGGPSAHMIQNPNSQNFVLKALVEKCWLSLVLHQCTPNDEPIPCFESRGPNLELFTCMPLTTA